MSTSLYFSHCTPPQPYGKIIKKKNNQPKKAPQSRACDLRWKLLTKRIGKGKRGTSCDNCVYICNGYPLHVYIKDKWCTSNAHHPPGDAPLVPEQWQAAWWISPLFMLFLYMISYVTEYPFSKFRSVVLILRHPSSLCPLQCHWWQDSRRSWEN